jgi:predicted phosphodiesterase
MKICLFSDIHGNANAFAEAKKMIVDEAADINVFLGDLCGYYFDELAVLKSLKELPHLIAIKGNHDDSFLRAYQDSNCIQEYTQKYGKALRHCFSQDCSGLIAWLAEQPNYHEDVRNKFSCFHGSPWDHLNGYVYPDTDLSEFVTLPQGWFFLGHTHYPMFREIDGRIVVNPGSLGQPRNGCWPTYAVLDLATRDVVFKEVQYDAGRLLRNVEVLDPESRYLGELIRRYYHE